MAYVTDTTKRPVEMLLGLINIDNNLSLVEADVEIKAPVAEPNPDPDTYPGHNTSVEIDLLTNEVEDEFVKFYYERVNLATLFSLIDPEFREFDVPLKPDGLPQDPAVFWAELERKFGVHFEATEFTYDLKSPGVITVKAIDENLAYIGEFDVDVVNSMATRVATQELDGFVAPAQP